MAYILNIFAQTLFGAISIRLFKRGRVNLDPEQNAAFDAYTGADMVISTGGNFLYAYPGKNSFSYLKHCHQIFLAQTMGKPTIFLAQSLGPVEKPLFRLILRSLINRSRKTLVREEWSLEFLKGLNVDMSRVSVTQDSAFLLTPAAPETGAQLLNKIGFTNDRPRIGMTVRNWEFPYAADHDNANEAFKKHIADTIDWMIERWGAQVVVMPQCISGDQDDRKCMRDILAKVRRKESTVVIEDDLAPEVMKAVYGHLDLFIGTRMHSNIFAAAMATPTFAISYQPKTDGIMKMLGMERWKMSIDDVTANGLQALLSEMWEERKIIRAQLESRMIEIRKQAREDILTAVHISPAPVSG